MSLINQMLQDLEKRRTEELEASPRYEQYGAAPMGTGSAFRWSTALLIFALVLMGFFWLYKGSAVKSEAKLAYGAGSAASIDQQPQLPVATEAVVSAITQPQSVSQDGMPDMSELPLLLKFSGQLSKGNSLSNEGSAHVAPVIENVDAGKNSKSLKPTSQGTASQETVNTSAVVADIKSKSEHLAPTKMEIAKDSLKMDKTEKNTSGLASGTMVKEISLQQRAESEYRQATIYQQQGRTNEAIITLENALKLDAGHAPARQALISLLLENNRHDDAMRLLKQAVANDPAQLSLVMVLARLQVERGKVAEAVETLQHSLNQAQDRPEYLAFLAALQQKLGQHKEAVQLYRSALKKHAQNGVWWMGLGISLQADGASQEAIEAFKQAKVQPGLGADLQAFVDQKIMQLQK
jgi:MSHA biogenesis protein MshN